MSGRPLLCGAMGLAESGEMAKLEKSLASLIFVEG
jgi:hypothetical protein